MADFHLGAKWGTPREGDSFDQAEEAIRKALDLGADLIVILGDIFDSRIPKLEVWDRALRIFSLPKLATKRGPKIVSTKYKAMNNIPALCFQGIPVIALCGNHEKRTRGLKNPVEALESAGKLIYLEAATVVLEQDGEKVAVHGFSYVPDKYVVAQLRTWNPRPIPGAFNILAFHQSIGEFVFSREEEKSMLQVSDLPSGFDLYINGHVHYRAETEVNGAPLLMPGSTERTQLLEVEAKNPKGFYLIETEPKIKWDFIELRTPRDFFYEEVRVENISLQDLYTKVRNKIRELLLRHRKNTAKPPIIRIRLLGTLSREISRADFDERMLEEEFKDQALVTVSKDALVSPGLEEKLRSLREFKERQLSIDEKGMLLLEEYVKDVKGIELISVRDLFGLLAEDRVDEALERLMSLVRKMGAEVGQ
jgi:DNA repair exonuclease SbcCD nuclease subunit